MEPNWEQRISGMGMFTKRYKLWKIVGPKIWKSLWTSKRVARSNQRIRIVNLAD